MNLFLRPGWGAAVLLFTSSLCADPPAAPPPAPPDPFAQELLQALRDASNDPRVRAAAPPTNPDDLVPRIRIERYTLANGLDVVLAPGGSDLQAVISVTYGTGTGDCLPARAALAHLAEHLSYRQTRHVPEGLLIATERADATSYNGATRTEETFYYAVVPAGSIERMLWIESERMAFALDGLDAAALAHEQRVVINEHRQRTTSVGWGDLAVALARELYPESHLRRVPYALPDGIASVTLGDVQDFLRTAYVPANARLTITGGFDVARVRGWVERYFGSIARAPAPPHPHPGGVVQLAGERVLRYRVPSAQNEVLVLWPTPPLRAPGDADLDVVAALLTREPGGALRDALVRSGLALTVAARQSSYDDSSEFAIHAVVHPNHTAEQVLDAIDRTLVQMRREASPAAQVEAVVRDWTHQTVQNAESLVGRAMLVAASPDARDPGLLRTDLARYRAVRPDTARATVERWLPLDRRLVVLVARDPNAPVGGVVESVRSR